MTREEANAELSKLVEEMTATFNAAAALAREHDLKFNLELGSESDTYTYTTHIEVSRYGAVESWTTSTWNDSGSSIDPEWDSSEC